MKPLALLGLSLLLLGSCAGSGSVILTQDAADAQTADSKTPDLFVEETLPDLALPDIPVEPDELHFDVEADTGGPACAPGEGCFLDPCDSNEDCLSGWCVGHMGEDVCTVQCQTECPAGWSCQQVPGTIPDVVWICVSSHANLCLPCSAGADCKGAAGVDDVCVDYGEEGSFCGGACLSDEECPWGFSCEEAVTVSGISTWQCVADAGVCPCTTKSIELALFTPCEVESEFGVCEGKRVCTDSGLTECDAAAPSMEVCDGLDNDCDGEVDEGTLIDDVYLSLCDDGNPCTKDKCLGAEGCENAALDGGECMDDNPCTVADHCEAGVCVGEAVDCDDNNPCTEDFCNPAGGCSHGSASGECDDGDPCTLGDHCSNKECVGEPVACDCQKDADCNALEDGNLCNGTLYCNTETVPFQCDIEPDTEILCPEPTGPDAPCLAASCDPATGKCSLVPANDGKPCEDGDLCTLGDTCNAGTCVGGKAANCNDGNPCTDDWCNPAEGCAHANSTKECNDGNVCTIQDACAGGLCVGGAPLVCNDGNACNGTESCDPATGCKAGTPLVCDDGNLCNGAESCDPATGCKAGTPLVCDDGNACNGAESCNPATGCKAGTAPVCDDGNLCNGTESCDPATGCKAGTPLSCDDGNPCNGAESCNPATGCKAGAPLICNDGNLCNGTESCDPATGCKAGTPLSCDDGNVCTDDTCDPATGCAHGNTGQKECDDGNACTVGDHCSEGKCVPAGLDKCDDDNLCTTDSCDPVKGCLHLLNTAPCDDGDLCTTKDTCQLGECVGGAPLNCNDDNPCTTDSCNPEAGCQFTPAPGPCDDGIECTVDDHCVAGKCVAGGLLVCNDGNPCTDDSCDIDLGCLFVDNDVACDDGNACTVGDQCAEGTCQPGPGALDCDDGNPCTTDSCNPAEGCAHSNTGQEDCDDGNACTVGDHCNEGECVGGGAPDCNDGNGCTDDSCDPDVGCVHANNNAACSDGNACTENDTCANGACQPGQAVSCDDGDPCTEDSCDPDQGCLHTQGPNCCGNGIVEPGEECDDGNDVNNDNCNNSCQFIGSTFSTYTQDGRKVFIFKSNSSAALSSYNTFCEDKGLQWFKPKSQADAQKLISHCYSLDSYHTWIITKNTTTAGTFGGYSVTVDSPSCVAYSNSGFSGIRKWGCSYCEPENHGYTRCWDGDHSYDWLVCQGL